MGNVPSVPDFSRLLPTFPTFSDFLSVCPRLFVPDFFPTFSSVPDFFVCPRLFGLGIQGRSKRADFACWKTDFAVFQGTGKFTQEETSSRRKKEAKDKMSQAMPAFHMNVAARRSSGWLTSRQACAPGTACCAPTKANARCGLGVEFLEAVGGGLQRGFFFAEGEAEVGAAVGGIAVEAGAGDGGDADLSYEMLCEGYVVGKAECRNVRHDVIGAARLEALESGVGENA